MKDTDFEVDMERAAGKPVHLSFVTHSYGFSNIGDLPELSREELIAWNKRYVDYLTELQAKLGHEVRNES